MWWHMVVHIFPLSCQWFVFLRFIFLFVFAIKLENRWIIESLILIITTGIQSDSVSRVEMEMWCLEADRNEYDYLTDPGPTDNLVMAFSSEQTFLSHSFHIKLNNWIFKFVRFLLTCAAGGQQAGRIKTGSIHLKGLVTFFSYTSVHFKKKKSDHLFLRCFQWSGVCRGNKHRLFRVVFLCDAVPRSHLGRA